MVAFTAVKVGQGVVVKDKGPFLVVADSLGFPDLRFPSSCRD